MKPEYVAELPDTTQLPTQVGWKRLTLEPGCVIVRIQSPADKQEIWSHLVLSNHDYVIDLGENLK